MVNRLRRKHTGWSSTRFYVGTSSIFNLFYPFNDKCSYYIETSQVICSAIQLTGFYMMGTLVVKRLIVYLTE